MKKQTEVPGGETWMKTSGRSCLSVINSASGLLKHRGHGVAWRCVSAVISQLAEHEQVLKEKQVPCERGQQQTAECFCVVFLHLAEFLFQSDCRCEIKRFNADVVQVKLNVKSMHWPQTAPRLHSHRWFDSSIAVKLLYFSCSRFISVSVEPSWTQSEFMSDVFDLFFGVMTQAEFMWSRWCYSSWVSDM